MLGRITMVLIVTFSLLSGCSHPDLTDPNTKLMPPELALTAVSSQFLVDFRAYAEGDLLHEADWTRLARSPSGSVPILSDWLVKDVPGSWTGRAIQLENTLVETFDQGVIRWDSTATLEPPLEILTRLWVPPDLQFHPRVGVAWFVQESDDAGGFYAFTLVRNSLGNLSQGFEIVRFFGNSGWGNWRRYWNDGLDGGWVWIRVQHTVGTSDGTIRFRVWEGALEDEPSIWHAERSSNWFGPQGGPYGPAISGKAGLYVGGSQLMAGADLYWDVLTLGIHGMPAPPPPGPSAASLVCKGAVRGERVECTVAVEPSTTPLVVKGWSFNTDLRSGPHTIPGPSEGLTWSGIGVQPGTVRADVVVDGTPVTLTAELTIVDRTGPGWAWNSQQWKYDDRQGALCDNDFTPFVIPGSTRLGVNRRKADCELGSIDPAIRQNPAAGIDTAQVLGGPNGGLWYVANVHYHMDRGSRLNPSIEASGPLQPVTHGADRSKCRKARNLSPQDPINESFFTYNEVCQSQNLTGFLTGILNHEGFGTDDQKNGHEAQRRLAAVLPVNDPRAAVESIVASTLDLLVLHVGTTADQVDVRLSQAGDAEHSVVHSNWCGQVFVQNVSKKNSPYTLIDVWADAVTKTCL